MKFDRTAREKASCSLTNKTANDVRSRQSSFLVLAGFGVVLLTIALAAFHPQADNGNNISELQIALHTDREIYHSGETMGMAVDLTEGVENATLFIKGIKDSMGKYRIQQDYPVPSQPVQKQLNFTFVVPSCYGCAGISPGEYEIFAELFSGNAQIANTTKTVRLEK